MPALPKIFLIKELQRHLRAGHPWVFSDAVRVPPKTQSGVVVLCEPGPKAKFIAYGLYQAESALAFRVLSLQESVLPDAALIERRLLSARLLRKQFIDPATTNAYRLLHGEGDLLPGVICDIYGEVAVLKYDNAAARAFYDETLVSSFQRAFLGGVSALYERFYERQDNQEKGALRFGSLPPEEIEIVEHHMRLGVDVQLGQKTGFFLDQRENRHLVRSLGKGRRVLNCFSYTGGFSVAAALGGATQTTSVDISAPVIEAAKKNFTRNNLDASAHRFYAEDAFTFLRREAQTNQKYELVILDPPSFAPNEKSKPQALGAYKELNQLGLKVLAEGGFLCTASCSSHLKEDEFLSIVRDAASQERRLLRVVSRQGAGPDHPVPPAFTEGTYLKFIVAY
jgi:23S rRNA (cytosine1962-C5)-methyltransferase